MTLNKHSMVETVLWMVAITSWVVYIEPSLTDALMFGFIMISMLFFGTQILQKQFLLAILLILYIAFELIAVTNAINSAAHAVRFSLITIYLLTFMYCLTGMLKLNGERLFIKLMDGWVIAAFLSSLVAILGFLDIIPREWVMKNDEGFRMHGFFKDPNVYGPHLVPAILYLFAFKSNVITENFGKLVRFIVLASLIIALLLSFSRAAYINMGVSVFLFYVMNSWVKNGFLAVFFSISKIAVLALILIVVIFQFSSLLGIDEILTSRLTIQEYDTGRFNNWTASFEVLLKNPLGIGPGQYRLSSYAGIHSLYLAIATESGVITFLLFLTLICSSLIRGFVMSFKSPGGSVMFIFAFAALAGVLVNSIVLNTVHWRHLFILIALGFGSYHKLSRQSHNEVEVR